MDENIKMKNKKERKEGEVGVWSEWECVGR